MSSQALWGLRTVIQISTPSQETTGDRGDAAKQDFAFYRNVDLLGYNRAQQFHVHAYIALETIFLQCALKKNHKVGRALL